MNDITAANVLGCGATVGIVSGMFGGPVVGTVGVVAGGVLGAFVGWSKYAQDQIEGGKKVGREILDRTKEFMYEKGTYLLGGGLSFTSVMVGAKILEPLCSSSNDFFCFIPKVAGNVLVLGGTAMALYIIYLATMQPKPKPTSVTPPSSEESMGSTILHEIEKYKPKNREECKRTISKVGCTNLYGGIAVTVICPPVGAVGAVMIGVGVGAGISRGIIEIKEWWNS